MIVLDENISEEQRQVLVRWRMRVGQIGHDIGRKGMQDENQIIPLLRNLPSPTFVTRDSDFWNQQLCHSDYCLVSLDLIHDEVALFVRRALRHPLLNTKRKRMGRIVEISHIGLRIATSRDAPIFSPWE